MSRPPPKRRTVRRATPKAASHPPADLARERRIRGKLDELSALLEGGALNPDRTRAYLAGELEAAPMNEHDETPISVRLPRSVIAVADDLAERRAARTGERASRSAVLRLAIERGIATLQREAAELDAPRTKAAILAELEALRERVDAWHRKGAVMEAAHRAELAEHDTMSTHFLAAAAVPGSSMNDADEWVASAPLDAAGKVRFRAFIEAARLALAAQEPGADDER